MKVLVVTGRLAQDLVRFFARGADVLVLDVDVAAFITPKMLLQALPTGYDLILIPGAITADFREAEYKLGSKIRLGPKHAADLGFVLCHIDEVELSPCIPACVLMDGKMRRNADEQVNLLEAKAEFALKINCTKIGGTSRMKVLAEIVDATRFGKDALTKKIRYYESQGADMIDLGVPLDARSPEVRAALDIARNATHLPVSVDTVSPKLILTGIKSGVDLVLSLNGQNLAHTGEAIAAAGVPAVIIPGPGQISLEENLARALAMGVSVIADPVLDPPLQGLAHSLQKYMCFQEAHPNIPLFFGAGNVTELLDADTVGANALLAALGAEVHASVLFTPEYSAKARGSIEELRRASQMMMLAQSRSTPPKDLGIDLLILKEKRHYPEDEMPREFIRADTYHEYEPDPSGSFRICLSQGLILARNSRTIVAGTNARDILNTIIDQGVVLRPDHAGYLGRELEKAEIALSLKRSYIQDEPLWPLKKVK
jgi:dihydropteroate synthase-like protein